MRVLHIGKFYPPKFGGMERVISQLCEGLVREGHHVKVCAASSDHVTFQTRRSVVNGVELSLLPTYGQIFSQPLISGLKNEIEVFQPDLIHFHVPNPLALSLGWNRKIPSVATVHAEADGIKGWIDLQISKHFLRDSRALIFTSDETARLWLEKSELAKETLAEVIPHGLDFSYLHKDLHSLSQQNFGRKLAEPFILFAGRLVPYKGVEFLIESMLKVDCDLLIVGTGPLESQLKSRAQSLGLSRKIQFVGPVSDQELAVLFQNCSTYVQPSISTAEGFGITMLEAMSFGKPVISTDLPTGVKSVNIHMQTGLMIPPKDVSALSGAINLLLSDKSLAQRLGQEAIAHVTKFNFSQMVSAHIKLYQSLF